MPILVILLGIFFYIYFEVSLLVSVGATIGILPTILLLLSLSFMGLWFVKLRGAYTLLAIRQDLSQGRMPAAAVGNSIMFLLAGVLLIIPGFLSDILAVLCVLPVTRKLIQTFVFNTFKNRVFMHFTSSIKHFYSHATSENETFEAEFEYKPDVNEHDKRLK